MGKMGRPEEDDAEPLYAMAEIVYNNPEMNLTSVIRIVIESMTGFHSEESIIKRLSRKFNRDREFLMDRVRSRKERPVVYLPPRRKEPVLDFTMLGLATRELDRSLRGSWDVPLTANDQMRQAMERLSIEMDPFAREMKLISDMDITGVKQMAEIGTHLQDAGLSEVAKRVSNMEFAGLANVAEAMSRINTPALVDAASNAVAQMERLQAMLNPRI